MRGVQKSGGAGNPNRSGTFAAVRFVCAALVLLIVPAWSVAADPEADRIIREVERNELTAHSSMELSMTVYDDGRVSSGGKRFSIRLLSRGEDETYMEVIEPRSIRGLRVLTLGKESRLFFPSTGRVRVIAGSSRGQSVQGIGGDFSYEDIGSGGWDDTYTFGMLETRGDRYVLEGTPKEPDPVYSRVVLTVDRSLMLPVKAEFYTTKDGHLKTLEMSEFKVFDGKTIAARMEMRNHTKGSLTVVEVFEAEYRSVPDEKYFNPMRFNR